MRGAEMRVGSINIKPHQQASAPSPYPPTPAPTPITHHPSPIPHHSPHSLSSSILPESLWSSSVRAMSPSSSTNLDGSWGWVGVGGGGVGRLHGSYNLKHVLLDPVPPRSAGATTPTNQPPTNHHPPQPPRAHLDDLPLELPLHVRAVQRLGHHAVQPLIAELPAPRAPVAKRALVQPVHQLAEQHRLADGEEGVEEHPPPLVAQVDHLAPVRLPDLLPPHHAGAVHRALDQPVGAGCTHRVGGALGRMCWGVGGGQAAVRSAQTHSPPGTTTHAPCTATHAPIHCCCSPKSVHLDQVAQLLVHDEAGACRLEGEGWGHALA